MVELALMAAVRLEHLESLQVALDFLVVRFGPVDSGRLPWERVVKMDCCLNGGVRGIRTSDLSNVNAAL